MSDDPARRGPDRMGIDWRGKAGAACLGLATGVGINLASDGIVGWLGVATALMLAGIGLATAWLRRQQLPDHAALARFTIPVLLILAAIAAVCSLVVPAAWTRPTVFAAAILVAAAVLIPTSTRVALSLLLGAAGIGVGVGIAGGAVGLLLDGKTVVISVAGIGVGVGIAGGALGILLDSKTVVDAERAGADVALVVGAGVAPVRGGTRRFSVVLLGAGRLGAGAAVSVMATRLLFHGDTLFGAAGLGGGVAIAGLGTRLLINRRNPEHTTSLTMAGLGVAAALAGVGIGFLLDGNTLVGVGGLGAGVAITSGSFGFLLRKGLLVGWAQLGGGLALAVMAIGLLLQRATLVGLAFVAVAIACTGIGVALLHRLDVWRCCQRWLMGQ